MPNNPDRVGGTPQPDDHRICNATEEYETSCRIWRPRISRDFVFIETEEGVLLDGLGRMEVIRGPLAQTILPRLIELMNGTRSLPDLAAEFSTLSESTIVTAVQMLADWNVVEEDAGFVSPSERHADTIAFLRRSAASAKLNFSNAEALNRLDSGRVLIVVSAQELACADRLRLLLENSGIGSSAIISHDAFDTADVPQGTLVLALTNLGDPGHRLAMSTGLETQDSFPWMRVAYDGGAGRLDIGPVFRHSSETCYQCFHQVHGDSTTKNDGSHIDEDNVAAWSSLVAIEVIYSIALPELALGVREFRRFRIRDWDSQLLKYPRLPGCQSCRPEIFLLTKLSQEPLTDTALVFEEYVGAESRLKIGLPSGEQVVRNRAFLNSEAKTLPNCEQLPLPTATIPLNMRLLDPPLAGDFGGPLTIDKLAIILALTAGIREIRGTEVRRWAATAGNLGSVELFLAVTNVDGLEEGIYFYQSREHQLARLNLTGKLGTAEFIRRALGRKDGGLPDALVLFTGAFHRVIPKYGSFGYRLINLDAGACLSQLHLVARGMKVWSRIATRWADDLVERELNLKAPSELCTAAVELSVRPPSRNMFSFLKKSLPQSEGFASWKTASQLQGLNLLDVTDLLVQQSRFTEEDFRFQARKFGRKVRKGKSSPRVNISLPGPLKGGAALSLVLKNRRSIRIFDDSNVPLAHVGTALLHANKAAENLWPEENKPGAPLTFFLFANRVTGLNAGIYEYRPHTRDLAGIAPAVSRAETSELFVQPEFADAAFLVWIVGNLSSACKRHGAYGHRQLLLRAGFAGHTLWMTSLSLGLCGSLIAGLIPGAARRVLGLDGFSRASLFAVAAGHQRGQEHDDFGNSSGPVSQ